MAMHPDHKALGSHEDRISACLRRIREAQGALDEARRLCEAETIGVGVDSRQAPHAHVLKDAPIVDRASVSGACAHPHDTGFTDKLGGVDGRARPAKQDGLLHTLPGAVNTEEDLPSLSQPHSNSGHHTEGAPGHDAKGGRMSKLLIRGGLSASKGRSSTKTSFSSRAVRDASEADVISSHGVSMSNSIICTDQAVVAASQLDPTIGTYYDSLRRTSFDLRGIGGTNGLRTGEVDGTIVVRWFIRGSCTACSCSWIWLVNPNALAGLLWLVFGVACMFYEAVVIPYYLAFEVDAQGFWAVVTNMITVYFLLDIVVTFFTAQPKPGGVLVIELGDIAVQYAKSWLFLDLLAAMPWEWLSIENSEVKLTRATKVLRFVRLVPRLMKLKHRLKSISTWFDGSRVFLFIYGIARIVAILLFISHWLSCVWYWVGGLDSGMPTWREAAADVYEQDFSTKIQQYVWSLYFTIATMTTIGYGDINPTNYNEACFGLLLLPIASVGFAAMMGTLTDLIATINTAGRLLSERKMKLSHYLRWRKVPKALEVRLREYLLYLWDLKQDYDSYEEDLKMLLPSVLNEELCFHLYGKMLQQAPFLEFMREFPVCMQQLCSMLKLAHRQRGDHLFRVGERNDQVHIIQSGAVWLSLNQNLFGGSEKGGITSPIASGKLTKRPSAFMSAVPRMKGPPAEKIATVVEAMMSIDDTLMTDAGKRLRLRDVAMRRSARLIQRAWRESRCDNSFKPDCATSRKPKGKFGVNWMRSHLVQAPAYFGEACLWVPLDRWDVHAPTYKYAARCESLVEQITMERSSLQVVIDHFSPWLGDRFEFFREAVAESMQEFSHLSDEQNGKELFSSKLHDAKLAKDLPVGPEVPEPLRTAASNLRLPSSEPDLLASEIDVGNCNKNTWAEPPHLPGGLNE